MNDFAYLVKLEVENNRNAYVRMAADGDVFILEQGRVGATPFVRKRPMSVWDETYRKYIGSGYEDRTSVLKETVNKRSVYKDIDDPVVKRFVDYIRKEANQILAESYQVTYEMVSEKMINDSQAVLLQIQSETNVEKVNILLSELFRVIPRKMKDVSDYLAKSKSDFAAIISREQSILDIMTAKVHQAEREEEKDDRKTILDIHGVNIFEVKDQVALDQIKRNMASESNHLMKRVFRVSNNKTDMKFKKFMDDYDYSKDHIHYLFHGSRNENIWGLITEGQNLYPKAHITGKMFGYGLYYANRAKKSINYTSLKDSYWANGNSDVGYLAVYKVLYKNPLDIFDYSSKMSGWHKSDIAPHDAVYAHKGRCLYNDEIIVYNEAQVTLQYMIELGNDK